MKIRVAVNEAGYIVAAYVRPEDRDYSTTEEKPPSIGVLPSQGEEVLDLDLPDEDVPSEPGPDFLEMLQRAKDRGSSEAKD